MNQITPWIKLYLPTACAKYAHWLVHMIWRAPQNLNLKKYTSMLFCRCSISCSVILLNSAGFLSLIAEKQLANFSWLQKHRSKIELAWFYKVTGRIMQFWCKLLDFYFPLTFSRIIIPANFYLKLQIWNDCGWNALIGYNDFKEGKFLKKQWCCVSGWE